jgi:tRNA-2-methylthio-N6-dimethylallyladenosine synthase
MARHENICKYIHLPVQSGNTRILQMMNRNYTREWYLNKVQRVREIMPDCGLSTDIISGFCSETEAEHKETLDLMAQCGYDMAYMFAYSERPGTLAEKRYPDDVPAETKKRRLEEIIELQRHKSTESYRLDEGKTFTVLVESVSKRSDAHWSGRNSQNKMVVFPKPAQELKPGDYARVRITASTGATLLGEMVG